MEPRTKHPGRTGRPTKYKEAYARQAKKLCSLGATDMELADFFEVDLSTVNLWKLRHKHFSEAIRVAKAVADDRVERSLYEKAMGYTFDSEKIFQFQGEVIRANTREHVPPSDSAIIFWLKNRRKEIWRDKHEVDNTGEVTHKWEEMDDEQLDRAIKARQDSVLRTAGGEGPAAETKPS